MSSSPKVTVSPLKNTAKVKIVFSGLEQLYATLEGLPLDMQSEIIGSSVGEAVKPLVRLAKSYAPKRTGALAASITSKVVKSKIKGTAVAIMGPSKQRFKGKKAVKKGESKAGSEQPSRYAHLVEFGHMTSKGRVGARPFMRPATAAGQEQVGRLMLVGIGNGINKAVKKYKKQNF